MAGTECPRAIVDPVVQPLARLDTIGQLKGHRLGEVVPTLFATNRRSIRTSKLLLAQILSRRQFTVFILGNLNRDGVLRVVVGDALCLVTACRNLFDNLVVVLTHLVVGDRRELDTAVSSVFHGLSVCWDHNGIIWVGFVNLSNRNALLINLREDKLEVVALQSVVEGLGALDSCRHTLILRVGVGHVDVLGPTARYRGGRELIRNLKGVARNLSPILKLNDLQRFGWLNLINPVIACSRNLQLYRR